VADKNNEPDRPIVVGVDGSSGSRTALRWAMAHARLLDTRVEAVAAWQEPLVYRYSPDRSLTTPDGDTIGTLTEKILLATVAEVVAEGGPPVDVQTRTVQGHAAEVLLGAAAGAQLLVVGARGHNTFAGILLGSVSQHCIQHAPCPVVVVPA
jgi:nucleotide-binding universal stress UspA family protein